MNKLPKFSGDNGQWVYDRIIPVHSPNVIPVSKRDFELLDNMYKERQGIFNKAILDFKNVIANGYNFHEPAEAKQSINECLIDNNSALDFFERMIEKRKEYVTRNDASTANTIYRVYKN